MRAVKIHTQNVTLLRRLSSAPALRIKNQLRAPWPGWVAPLAGALTPPTKGLQIQPQVGVHTERNQSMLLSLSPYPFSLSKVNKKTERESPLRNEAKMIGFGF